MPANNPGAYRKPSGASVKSMKSSIKRKFRNSGKSPGNSKDSRKRPKK